ncbi:hypothetical protein M9H77_19913 [Catharanthus roseus]|uniref:Uncharacterized protein n=1 Tax=Catharanthus roseus TaxID=4058 RepID=A0ACC0BBP9_CATRO|nr:hypothetical protein M9H77_19913 [Catharanthus roseus]
MGSGVTGVLLEASALFTEDDTGKAAFLRPSAHSLLRRLRYSKILTAIFYEPGFPAPKVALLEEMSGRNMFDCLILVSSSTEDIVREVTSAWGTARANCVIVVSGQKEDISQKLKNSGWLTVILRTSGEGSFKDFEYSGRENSSLVINKLEELPFIICHLNKKANSMENILVVGYVMKPSREEDFAKRGALPLCPTANGLMFVPLSYELPVASQLQQVDGVLHKATDEIVGVEMGYASDNKVIFSAGLQELQRCIERQTDCCVIDQFQNIYPVIDREKIQQILVGLESICTKSPYKTRGPHFLKIDSFEEPNLESRLLEANLSLPNIVKPQVACGVADAHSMAIVFKVDDYKGLNVPLPAVVQEYVDHSSRLFKFYVLGEKIFYAIKNSTPNAATLMSLSEENYLKPILFDSLKSLPVATENKQLCNKDHAGNQEIDLELVTDAANWLGKILELTIFGFDLVIQEGTGDHVIVDLNYLPSFKEVPDDVAVPAFWEAIKRRLELKRNK